MIVATAGQFKIEGNTISGPAEYMREQGNAYLEKILKGESVAFNMSAHLSPNVQTAICVFMQTDYAGWLGMKGLQLSLKG